MLGETTFQKILILSSEKYLLKRSFIEITCSWRHKFIILCEVFLRYKHPSFRPLIHCQAKCDSNPRLSVLTVLTLFYLLKRTLIYTNEYCSLAQHLLTLSVFLINRIQDGTFTGCLYGWRIKKFPIPKICHTYPTMIKLGIAIPCLKKIQKLY